MNKMTKKEELSKSLMALSLEVDSSIVDDIEKKVVAYVKEENIKSISSSIEFSVVINRLIKAINKKEVELPVEFAEWIADNGYVRFYKPNTPPFWVYCSEGDWFGEDERKITSNNLYMKFIADKYVSNNFKI